MSEINVPLLRKALEHITEHPEEWYQGEWITKFSCRTACCLAGHVALMEGWTPSYDAPALNGAVAHAGVASKDGVPKSVREIASEALGISMSDSMTLFAPTNSLYELWAGAERLTGGEIQVPPEVVESEQRRIDAERQLQEAERQLQERAAQQLRDSVVHRYHVEAPVPF